METKKQIKSFDIKCNNSQDMQVIKTSYQEMGRAKFLKNFIIGF